MPYSSLSECPLSLVVKSAKYGCTEAMAELPKRLSHDYSPDIVDAILFHLKSRRSKRQWNEMDLASWRNTCLCTLAFKILDHIWEICPPAYLEATAHQISNRMPDLVYTAFCVMRRVKDPKSNKIKFDAHVPPEDIEVTAGMTVIFNGFATFHEHLRKPMFEFDDVLELSLLLWVATIDGDPFVYPNGRRDIYQEAVDPATYLFKYALESNAAGVAAAILRGKVCTPEAFAQATIRRMKSWLNLKTLKHLRALRIQTHEDTSIAYCVHMAEMLMGAHPTIFRLMIEHRVPEVFMRVLAELDTFNCADSKNHVKSCGAKLTIRSMDVLELALVVIRWTEDSPFQPAVASAKGLMMAKSVLQLLRNCVTRRVPMAKGLAGKESDVVQDILQTLFRLSMYPRAAPVFAMLCLIVCSTDSQFHRSGMKNLRGVIVKFTRSLTTRIPKEIVHERIKLCDNFEHRHSQDCNDEFGLQKTCAKCHSVVYCSTECQARDWAVRHRHECRAMYIDYLERKHSATWYSHNARSYHLTILRHVYAKEVKKLENPLSGKLIIKLDVADIAQPCGHDELDSYVKATITVVAACKRSRFKQLMEKAEALRGGLTDNERLSGLVDGVFWFGDQELHVVVLFHKKSDQEWSGAASDLVVEGSIAYTRPREITSRPQYPDLNTWDPAMGCIEGGSCEH